ncbi:MAG: class III extradiol ring-cleavage dioxygenase [Gallionella sp.]
MYTRMPVVFVSHGAPDALLKAPDAVAMWSEIGRSVPKPVAILAVSAHWESFRPTVSAAESPETIHDFSGFQQELYRIKYRAPGAPALAARARVLLAAAGLPVDSDSGRGLDHGAWVPLSVMYPEADVPVTQLALLRSADAASHYELGRALTVLRDEGVLIVASGAVTHNFSWLNRHAKSDTPPLPQAEAFTDWVAERLAAQDISGLLNYRSAPYGADAHPSEEHFLPLFVALGAVREDRPRRFRPRFTYGGLAMDAYVWGDTGDVA